MQILHILKIRVFIFLWISFLFFLFLNTLKLIKCVKNILYTYCKWQHLLLNGERANDVLKGHG